MENFNDGDYKGWQPIGRIKDCWKVVDGELCGDTKSIFSAELILNMPGETWDEHTLSCDIRFIEKYYNEFNRPHVAIGTSIDIEEMNPEELSRDGVTFQFGFEGATIIKRHEGKTTVEDERFDVFIGRTNAWYRLKLVIEDESARGYINNNLVCELKRDMPRYRSMLLSFSNAHVCFDNVIIWGDAILDRHTRTATTWANIKGKQQ